MGLRAEPLIAALAPLLCAGCGGSETGQSVAVSMKDDGIEYRAEWTYRSFDVDVDLVLATLERDGTCSSSGSLVINDVVSSEESYMLAATDCAVLRLSDAGDIILHSSPTGHDWTAEALKVDTEREIVLLGPVALIEPETGANVSYRFTLSAPPCPDDPDCDCGALERRGGATQLSLDLGRRCD